MVALFAVFSALPLDANDLIYLQRPGIDNPPPIVGTIDEFTGRFIQFRTSSSTRPRQEPTRLVIRVEPRFSDAFNRAGKLFDNGQFDAAEAEWKQELAREARPWVQREIRARLIHAAWRQDHWTDAGEQFLAIVAEDPDTFHWSIAPLMWSPGALREADRVAARTWLDDPSPVARLLSASLLLKDAATSAMAAQTLNSLMRETSSQVSGLAKAQLWRNNSAPTISDNELTSWRFHIGVLPETLRSGPQFLLGSAYLRRGQFDRAAAELLWVPLIYSQHEPTAARASLDAGESLLRGGRREEATRILSETVEKYPWSPAARDAKSRLAELERDSI
jgi:tetratricopeptide (TPR) repeat protein